MTNSDPTSTDLNGVHWWTKSIGLELIYLRCLVCRLSIFLLLLRPIAFLTQIWNKNGLIVTVFLFSICVYACVCARVLPTWMNFSASSSPTYMYNVLCAIQKALPLLYSVLFLHTVLCSLLIPIALILENYQLAKNSFFFFLGFYFCVEGFCLGFILEIAKHTSHIDTGSNTWK